VALGSDIKTNDLCDMILPTEAIPAWKNIYARSIPININQCQGRLHALSPPISNQKNYFQN
jgi:hypothetical protein